MRENKIMVWKVRRVVTGHDSSGKSKILMDGLAPNVKEMESMPGLALTDLWETTAVMQEASLRSQTSISPWMLRRIGRLASG